MAKKILEELKDLPEQAETVNNNMPKALIAGGVSAAAGAVIWAVITAITEYQIGWMAVGLGFLVGFAVRKFGQGDHIKFGIVGGAMALAGCLLGNFLSLMYFVSAAEEVAFLDLLFSVDFLLIPGFMLETFELMDLLFYGIAVYEGVKFSVIERPQNI